MWDNFYDKVTYEKANGKDKTNSYSYPTKKVMYMRYVKGKDIAVQGKAGESIQFKRMYHSPIELFEGDRINNRVVKEVLPPARGIDGKIHFYRVWVI